MTIEELVIGDRPEAWAAAGFCVDDDGTCRLGTVRLRLAGEDDGRYLRGWALRGPDEVPPSIDGLASSAGGRPPAEPATHPNGAVAIDHLVVMSPDGDRTTEALTGVGLGVRRVRETGTYGAPMRQSFFRLREVVLELVAPAEPAGDGPARFFGLAVCSAELDATAAHLGENLGTPKDAVQPGRRIATLRHKALGLSTAVAFMSPEPARSPSDA